MIQNLKKKRQNNEIFDKNDVTYHVPNEKFEFSTECRGIVELINNSV